MQITQEIKSKIVSALLDDLKMRQKSDSGYKEAQHANYLSIHTAQYSRIKRGDLEKVLSESEWVRIAKKLFVDLSDHRWNNAKTVVLNFITSQLEFCQERSTCGLCCDLVGIGKTHAAQLYAASRQNVVYVKCFPGITRAELIRFMAECLGLSSDGTVARVRRSVVAELRRLKTPIVILDDGGYLNDNSWMEVKGLLDDVEFVCGWYVIGDTSLQKKIQRLLAKDKDGWQALFDRFGRKFQTITHQFGSDAEVAIMRRADADRILKANIPNITPELRTTILNTAGTSLRVLRREITKHKYLKPEEVA